MDIKQILELAKQNGAEVQLGVLKQLEIMSECDAVVSAAEAEKMQMISEAESDFDMKKKAAGTRLAAQLKAVKETYCPIDGVELTLRSDDDVQTVKYCTICGKDWQFPK
jgi:hypothetical protein